MRRFFRSTTLHILLALLAGLGAGLFYSWRISPVTYVDANPALLRADFKDQYRMAIAASYAATQDLARARARLNLLGEGDPTAELSAQAQRMLAAGEAFEQVRPLAQLATDLKQGFASNPISFSPTPFPTFNTPIVESTATIMETPELAAEVEATYTPVPTLFFEQTPLAPAAVATNAPPPTFTPTAGPGAPFTLVGQETICEPGQTPLLQFILQDARRRQMSGIEIIVTWSQGEDRFFTGFKPELGDGYADFHMQPEIVYNIRISAGGTFVPNVSTPVCTDPNGTQYPGSLALTFQQP